MALFVARGQPERLLWVRKVPLAWPEPSQPGKGQLPPLEFPEIFFGDDNLLRMTDGESNPLERPMIEEVAFI